jgi:PhzF family phenazine biosynthesis protein
MKYYVVDAFSSSVFHGNPAGVCVIDDDAWPADEMLLNIAAENNMPETAFLLKNLDRYNLRYFSPVYEVPLCGHATIASAFVVNRFLNPEWKEIVFETLSGELSVYPQNGFYEMKLPTRHVEPVAIDPMIERAIGCKILESYIWENDVFAVIESEDYLEKMEMDFSVLNHIPGIFNCCITAQSFGDFDFVSRLFSPNYIVPEDSVCGSAHCSLIPIWAHKLQKTTFTAKQVSRRGGILYCTYSGNTITIRGTAVLYLEGEILLNSDQKVTNQ